MASAPTEIWQLIIKFAATSEAVSTVDYQPFEPGPELQNTEESAIHERVRLRTCLALMLVSRRCRSLVAEFLYRDVCIYSPAGLSSLIQGLERSASEDGEKALGLHVRRLELLGRRSISQIATPSGDPDHDLPWPTAPIPLDDSAPSLANLLALCPQVNILVRPCLVLNTPNIIFWAHLVRDPIVQPSTHLRRLEWHETELDVRFYGNNHGARLRELVGTSPNLEYLSLSSDRPTALADLALRRTLHTLRLDCSHFDAAGNHQNCLASPPPKIVSSQSAVRQLILHTVTVLPNPLLDFIQTAGTQIQTLELAFSPQMVFPGNRLRQILVRTPALTELVYFLGAPEISALANGVRAPSVKRIRLKVDPDTWNPIRPVLRRQMEVLEGESFPELNELILHDPTRWFQRRELGREMLHRIIRRGCAISYSDGAPVVV